MSTSEATAPVAMTQEIWPIYPSPPALAGGEGGVRGVSKGEISATWVETLPHPALSPNAWARGRTDPVEFRRSALWGGEGIGGAAPADEVIA